MNKFTVKIFLCFVAILGLCNTALCDEGVGSVAINVTRMLEPTNASGSEKMYEPAKSMPPSIIVLHYTVTTTIDQTVNAFYGAGVSSHFTIDRDGEIYKHIEDGNVAYHAGQSFWHGKQSLNWWPSVGIEQINTGWDVNNSRWKESRSIAKEADGKQWETWTEEQIKSVAELTASLVDEYNIDSWNIIGHSDCACGRKPDPGPVFPWKKLHDEYGVGFWPEEGSTIAEELVNGLDDKDYIHFLHVFGYPVHGFASPVYIEELKKVVPPARLEGNRMGMQNMSNNLTDRQTIQCFQHHYMQDKFEDPSYRSGRLDDDTKIMILRCIKSAIKQVVDTEDYLFKMLKKLDFSDVAEEFIRNEKPDLRLKDEL
jgi:N-acetyl-anhydromuramyl-L-alanine amidase AmpD